MKYILLVFLCFAFFSCTEISPAGTPLPTATPIFTLPPMPSVTPITTVMPTTPSSLPPRSTQTPIPPVITRGAIVVSNGPNTLTVEGDFVVGKTLAVSVTGLSSFELANLYVNDIKVRKMVWVPSSRVFKAMFVPMTPTTHTVEVRIGIKSVLISTIVEISK